MTRKNFIKTSLLVTTGVLVTESFWVERYFFETNDFYMSTATKDTQNIKIVQISDLHLRSISYQLIKLIKKLNKLQPDLIVFTGDTIDRANNLSLLNNFLQLIDTKIKKVAILGNWEYQGNVDLIALDKIYTANNCDLLINQTRQYTFQNKTISITGVDDFLQGHPDFDTAIRNYKKSDYHVVLNHCPQYSDNISEQMKTDIPVDFILSGHTHGGQINFFGFVPYLPKGCGPYLKGWYNNNNPKMYVSKGIGTGTIAARFCARAEIAIFNLSA